MFAEQSMNVRTVDPALATVKNESSFLASFRRSRADGSFRLMVGGTKRSEAYHYSSRLRCSTASFASVSCSI